MHKIENIKQKIKNGRAKISMIPRCLTWHLQPLEISIKSKFKDKLRLYTEYCTEQVESNAKVFQNDLINLVADVWYSDKLSQK